MAVGEGQTPAGGRTPICPQIMWCALGQPCSPSSSLNPHLSKEDCLFFYNIHGGCEKKVVSELLWEIFNSQRWLRQSGMIKRPLEFGRGGVRASSQDIISKNSFNVLSSKNLY